MKNIKLKIIWSIFCAGIFINISTAQDINAFYDNLKNKDNFYEVMKIVDDEYKSLPEEIRDKGGKGYKKEKHWRRWEHWMSSHLGSNGEFVNFSQLNQDALKEVEAKSIEKATTSSWSFLGPNTSTYQSTQGYCIGNGLGRVDRIAFHPTDANIVYAGMPAGGLWRTTNGGTNWESLQDYSPSLGISGIAVSHTNPSTIYVLSGDGDSDISGGFVNDFGYIRPSAGVFKSVDNGVTWQQTGTLSTNNYVGYELVMAPNNSNVLYAATSDGLWKTSNGGTSWTQIRTGRIYDVNIKPNNSNRIYCATSSNFQFSSNGGSTWFVANFDINPPSGRKSITISNNAPNTVYLLCGGGPSSSGTFAGFYRSTNSGITFTRRANSPNILDAASDGSGNDDSSNYILCSAAKHSNQNIIVMGSLICFRSTNAGSTWNNSTTYWEDGGAWYVHPDIHEMKYNPLDNKVYVGHDGGIHVSSNDGISWTNITNGIKATQTYHLDQFTGSVQLLMGNQDNGVKRRVSGPNFPHVSSGDGFYPDFDPNNSARFLSSINKSLYLFSNSGNSRSGNIAPTTNWYKTVTFHNTNSSLVLCGSSDIHKSTNSGSTWNNESASGSWAIASCPSNNNRFYATGRTDYQPSTLGKAYVSSNTGDTWTDLSSNSGFPSTVTKLTDISARPTNSNFVWMTCGGYNAGSKVYFSSNAGGSWTNMSGSLPNIPIHCIAITTGNDAYIGTDIGVFYRASGWTDWIPFSNGLPNVPVTDIRLDATAGSGNIYISTFGRGIYWDNIVDDICLTSQSITGTLDGYRYYETSDVITSTADINGTTGNDVYFKASDRVVLTPGFKAEEHSEFRAYLGPCGVGGIPNATNDNTNNNLKNDEITEGENVHHNLSKFDIQGNEIDLYIKYKSDYVLQILDKNLKPLESINQEYYNVDTYRVQSSLDDYRDQDKLYYVGLFSENKMIYLQEID